MTDPLPASRIFKVSAELVRDFYETHPYPPPIEDLNDYRRRWRGKKRRRVDFHLLWPKQPFREDHTILIAGCGTSQAAKYAMRWPKAKVIGIDFSAKSIEHTHKLKQKYSLANLEAHQLSLEEVGKLGAEYDLIVSTGVLHHLPDPDAGLAALSACLAPAGAMHLMVYAPYGRTGIYMMQDYCRRLKIGTSSSEIRDLAASLQALPPNHPLIPLLRSSPDFRQEAALADALLNPLDRAYSVDEFFRFIDAADLKFVRWIRQAPYLPQCGGLTQVPHSALMRQLPDQEHFAAMELFRGNMLRHSAILFRSDLEPPAQPINFDSDAWLDYVPIRVSTAINVKDKLPAGTAAVLINQAHTQTDIYLPVNDLQEGMVEQIDGTRTIRQIMGKTAVDATEARTLFMRLWWYDQVVFDASKPGNSTKPARRAQ